MSLSDSFITNSYYPVDKIVWTAEGVISSSNPYWSNILGGGVLEPIIDGIPSTHILVDGAWSNNNWSTQYPINTNGRVMGYIQSGGSYVADFDEMNAEVWEEGAQILSYTIPYQCVFISGRSPSNRTLKYRVWAYILESEWGDKSDIKTAETLASKLQKNSSLPQLNMVAETIMTVPSDSTVTYTHNLGYRPYCKIWKRDGGIIDNWYRNEADTVFGPSNPYNLNKITIDTQNITIYAKDAYNGNPQDFLIRIYNHAIPL